MTTMINVMRAIFSGILLSSVVAAKSTIVVTQSFWQEASSCNQNKKDRENMRVKCDVVEWVKINTLKWFDYFERKKSESFVKKVYVCEIEVPRRRGRSVVG